MSHEPKPGRQVHASFPLQPIEGLSAGNAEIRYQLFLPNEFRSNETWPLMLFLHGAGERGTDLDLVKKHGPPRIVDTNLDFPFVVISPQCPANQRWNSSELLQLVDHVVGSYRVDKKRLYGTGLSMGAFGIWALLSTAPDRFAAALTICGGGNPGDADKLKSIPLWVFHGAKDPIVSIRHSEEMAKAIEAAGGRVKFTVYPDGGHDSWTETYNNQAVYDWLLAQSLP
jgi:predicted peptidase